MLKFFYMFDSGTDLDSIGLSSPNKTCTCKKIFSLSFSTEKMKTKVPIKGLQTAQHKSNTYFII